MKMTVKQERFCGFILSQEVVVRAKRALYRDKVSVSKSEKCLHSLLAAILSFTQNIINLRIVKLLFNFFNSFTYMCN